MRWLQELNTFWSVYSSQHRDIDHLPQQAMLPVVDPALLRLHFPQDIGCLDRGAWVAALQRLPDAGVVGYLADKLKIAQPLLQVMLPNLGEDLQAATLWQLRLLERQLWPGAVPHAALADATETRGWLLLQGAAAAAAAREQHDSGLADRVMYLMLIQVALNVPPARPWRDTQQQIRLATCYREAHSGGRFLREALTPSVILRGDYDELFQDVSLRKPEHLQFIDDLLHKLATTPTTHHPLVIHLAKKERPHVETTPRSSRRDWRR